MLVPIVAPAAAYSSPFGSKKKARASHIATRIVCSTSCDTAVGVIICNP